MCKKKEKDYTDIKVTDPLNHIFINTFIYLILGVAWQNDTLNIKNELLHGIY